MLQRRSRSEVTRQTAYRAFLLVRRTQGGKLAGNVQVPPRISTRRDPLEVDRGTATATSDTPTRKLMPRTSWPSSPREESPVPSAPEGHDTGTPEQDDANGMVVVSSQRDTQGSSAIGLAGANAGGIEGAIIAHELEAARRGVRGATHRETGRHDSPQGR